MQNVIDGTTPVSALTTMCDTEVLPLVGLHLWAGLATAQLDELRDEGSDVYRYTPESQQTSRTRPLVPTEGARKPTAALVVHSAGSQQHSQHVAQTLW